MIWTDKKKAQALNALASTDNNVDLAGKLLRRLWKRPVTVEELSTLLSPQPEVVDLKAEAAWKNYTPVQGPQRYDPGLPKNVELTRRIIIPDAHHPYVDKKAWSTALGIVKEWRPAAGVIIGDFGDFNCISRFVKGQSFQHALAEEYYFINLALDELQNASPNTHWTYIEGNHEERTRKYMAENPQVDGLLVVPEQLFITAPANGYYRNNGMLRGMDWVWLEDQPYITPHSAYWHGHHYAGPGAAAKNADTYSPAKCQNKPVFYGHLHTFHSFTSEIGTQSVCTGFLGEEKALHYIQEKPVPWVTGLVLQEVYGEHMSWTQIHIRDGKALMGGKLITAP